MQVDHGPADSRWLVVLAPGDEGRLTDPAPTAIAAGLADAGLRVLRFDSTPCHGDDAERDVLTEAGVRAAAAQRGPKQHLIVGGFSRGARVAAALAEELGAVGVLAFAYPFHARHDPDPHGRDDDLAGVAVPVLVCQGTRDSHGNQQQVRGYRLPSHIQVHWLQDANHALHPRARSGHRQADQLAEAARVAARFTRSLG